MHPLSQQHNPSCAEAIEPPQNISFLGEENNCEQKRRIDEIQYSSLPTQLQETVLGKRLPEQDAEGEKNLKRPKGNDAQKNASPKTYHWTKIVGRIEIPLNLLVKAGLITIKERNHLIKDFIPKNTKSSFAINHYHALCSIALEKIIEKVKRLGASCLPKEWVYEECLEKKVFKLKEFGNVIKVIQELYAACVISAIQRTEKDYSNLKTYCMFCDPFTELLEENELIERKEKAMIPPELLRRNPYDVLKTIDGFIATRDLLLKNIAFKNQLKNSIVNILKKMMLCEIRDFSIWVDEFDAGERLLHRIDPYAAILKPYTVNFERGETRQLYIAESLILSSSSLVFKAKLREKFKEDANKVIDCHKIKLSEFELILECLCNGKIPSWNSILILIKNAEQLKIPILFTICCNWIQTTILDKLSEKNDAYMTHAIMILYKLQGELKDIKTYKKIWNMTRDNIVSILLSQAKNKASFREMVELLPCCTNEEKPWPTYLSIPFDPDLIVESFPHFALHELDIIPPQGKANPKQLSFLKNFPHLNTLKLLCDCSEVQKEQWSILKDLKHLKHLQVNLYNPNEESFKCLLGNLPSLKSLVLSLQSPPDLAVKYKNPFYLDHFYSKLLSNLFESLSDLKTLEMQEVGVYECGIVHMKIDKSRLSADLTNVDFGYSQNTFLTQNTFLSLKTCKKLESLFPFIRSVSFYPRLELKHHHISTIRTNEGWLYVQS